MISTPLRGGVFVEIVGAHLEPQSPDPVDALHRQRAHLPMSVAVRVGIANETAVIFKDTFDHSFLSGALLFTLAGHNYFNH
jgi:hypothetical protein